MKRVVYVGDGITDVRSLAERMSFSETALVNELVWDEENPEYVIVNEQIYVDAHYFKQFCDHFRSGKNTVFIYLGGEAISPDMNLFDYAIVYNRKMHYLDRISRIPTNYLHGTGASFKNDIDFEKAESELGKKTEFCNFIYSNAHSHEMRDKLFYAVSSYKFVHSLGQHLNNVGNKPSRDNIDWKKKSIDIKSNYKFTIAAENAFYEGYTSEKLLTSFQAHSIPIYWGNPDVAEEYNERAFVNVHSFSSLDEVVERIKEIDENDSLWKEMICEPWQTEDQYERMERDYQCYLDFLKKIFMTDVCDAQRRPMGTAEDNYFNFFSRRFRSHRLVNYCKAFIKRLLINLHLWK